MDEPIKISEDQNPTPTDRLAFLKGISKKTWIIIGVCLAVAAISSGVTATVLLHPWASKPTVKSTQTTIQEEQKQPAPAVNVRWDLKEGNVYQATGTPPACPDPLTITTPVDVAKVTAILVPGQPRGPAWKPHGAFRFSDPNNTAAVSVPMDAQLVRGSRAFFNGENQYAFEFVAPCGIRYWFGHLLELSPKFLDIANKLPLVQFDSNGNPPKQQFFDIEGVQVKTGELIATKVGYVKDSNAVVDFGVLDMRKKNGAVVRPEWSKFADQLDVYAICWLDILPKADRDHLRGLFGGGDSVYGLKSDYCHYPENK